MKAAFFIFILSFSLSTFAQDSDSIGYAGKKNTIRWNITPMLIIGPKSLVLGYERIVNSHQSFSFNIGYLEKKPFSDDEGNPIQLFKKSSKGGVNLSADYRFYFKKRNKRIAPDGLYWGPYAGYYALWSEGEGNIIEDDEIINSITLDSQFQMISLGVQLGYQFVLWERMSIDLMLMGPSLTFYKIDMGLKTEFALDPDSEYYEDLKELIDNYIPFASDLLDNGEFSSSGKMKFRYLGFRYGIMIGYRF